MLHTLPPELSEQVFTHLSLNQCLSLRLVSSAWKELINKLFDSKFVYFIDHERSHAEQGDHSFATCVAKLSEQDFDITRICIRKYNLLQETPNLDAPIRRVLSRACYLKIADCELSNQFLWFILNRSALLKALHLQVLFDKSIPLTLVRSTELNFLTELNLSHSMAIVDKSFVLLCEHMKGLQVLNCVHTKMAFYPYYMRRYYSHYDDIEACWREPVNFGFTFNIIRGMLTFAARQLKTIHLGPNISIDNVQQLMPFQSLQNVHFLFPSKLEAETFEAKVHAQLNIKLPNKFHFDFIHNQIN